MRSKKHPYIYNGSELWEIISHNFVNAGACPVLGYQWNMKYCNLKGPQPLQSPSTSEKESKMIPRGTKLSGPPLNDIGNMCNKHTSSKCSRFYQCLQLKSKLLFQTAFYKRIIYILHSVLFPFTIRSTCNSVNFIPYYFILIFSLVPLQLFWCLSKMRRPCTSYAPDLRFRRGYPACFWGRT